ncbi:MAG: 4-coumarate--CoA ligase [Burkholderiaceae bacterium]|nr:MAG: 4-coumarate--CoA ligase [Burkholderiaceae bacterium]
MTLQQNELDHLLDQPFGSLPQLVAFHAAHRPRHTALILDDRTVDYAGLKAGMDRVAATLQQGGLKPGDALAVCAGTAIEYLFAFLGALRAGVAVAPLAPSTTAENLDAMLANSGARLLLRDREVATERWPVQAHHGLACVALDDAPEAGTAWSAWLAKEGSTPAPVAPEPDWPFNIIYSSGTTGVPKGIVQSWAMRWAHIRRAQRNGYGAGTISLVSTPLYSNTTLVAVVPTLALGSTLVLMRKFDAAKYLKLAERHRATHTMLVPVQYQRLMRCPDFDATDLHTLQNKFCTSSPFSAELKGEVLRRWPGRLIEYYGLTEGGLRCELHCHEFPNKLHTVGRPPADAIIRFIDDQGRELPPGVDGEIVGHSQGMMTGYYGLPEKTRAAEWFDAEGRRYIRSGDVGHMDEDGFIVLGDRKKDMIISGGFNIYPTDIEQALMRHPDVAECAVIGVPSERWGETPVAFVVPRKGTGPDAGKLKDWLNARVGKTQRVAELRFIARLPRSGIGKVLKRELRKTWDDTAKAGAGH